MFSVKSGQLLGLFGTIKEAISNVFTTIEDAFLDFFGALYMHICKTIYTAFLLPIARIADICQLVFRKFVGIEGMEIKGMTRSSIFGSSFSSNDILMNLISSDIVQRIFIAMLVLAVIMLIITTFVANIKAEFNPAEKGGNNRRKVFKNAIKGLVNFIVVPVTCIFAIIVSNALLQAIDGATQIGKGQTYLSGQLFVACGYNANRVRNSQDDSEGKGIGYYYAESFGALIAADFETGDGRSGSNGMGNFGIFVDDDGQYGARAADKIDQAFANNTYLVIKEDTRATQMYYGDKLDFWHGTIEMVFSTGSTTSVAGSYSTFPACYHGGKLSNVQKDSNGDYILHFYENRTYGAQDGHVSFSIYDVGMVSYYYDLSFASFSYLIFLIAGIYFAYVMIATAIGLVKRLFMVTTLFVISPPICALYPIDDGKALGNWRTAFIQEVLSAYAVIVVMNIFFSLLPLITRIEVFDVSSFPIGLMRMFPAMTWDINPSADATTNAVNAAENSGLANFNVAAMSGVVTLVNAFIRLMIIVGALHFFKKAVAAIAKIIGGGDAFSEGAEVAQKLGKTVAGVAALATGAGMAMKAKSMSGKLGKLKDENKALSGGGDGGDGGNGGDGGKPENNTTPDEKKSIQANNNGSGEKDGEKKGSSGGSGGGSGGSGGKKDDEPSGPTFVDTFRKMSLVKDVLTGKAGAKEVLDEKGPFKKQFEASAKQVKKMKGEIKKESKKLKEAQAQTNAAYKQAVEEHKREADPVYKAQAELNEAKTGQRIVDSNTDRVSALNKEKAKIQSREAPAPEKLTTVRAVKKEEVRKAKDQARLRNIDAEINRLQSEQRQVIEKTPDYDVYGEVEKKKQALKQAKKDNKKK